MPTASLLPRPHEVALRFSARIGRKLLQSVKERKYPVLVGRGMAHVGAVARVLPAMPNIGSTSAMPAFHNDLEVSTAPARTAVHLCPCKSGKGIDLSAKACR